MHCYYFVLHPSKLKIILVMKIINIQSLKRQNFLFMPLLNCLVEFPSAVVLGIPFAVPVVTFPASSISCLPLSCFSPLFGRYDGMAQMTV